jgi:hypothetical protein
MLLYICLYMRISKVHIFIFYLKGYLSQYADIGIYKMLLYIRQCYSSQRCPSIYSHICGSIMPLVYVKIKVLWRPILGFPNICLHVCVNKI